MTAALEKLVADLKADNARIAGERDRALSGEAAAVAKVIELERERDERTSALNLIPLSRAARMVGVDYIAAWRLVDGGAVLSARRTADGKHWICDPSEFAEAALHAGLIFRIGGADGA